MTPNPRLAPPRTREAAAESASSLEKLFRREYPKLVRAAWLLSGSREVAEDVVQDVFARLLRTPELEAADALDRYVYQSVINRVRSWQRRQVLERRHAATIQMEGVGPAELSGFRDFLAALSPRQRTAIVLRFYCDLPLAEVAALMGCRRGTVTVLIRRALGKARGMKEVLGDES